MSAAREVDVRAGHAAQGGCRLQVKNKGGGGMGKKGKEKKGICIHTAVGRMQVKKKGGYIYTHIPTSQNF